MAANAQQKDRSAIKIQNFVVTINLPRIGYQTESEDDFLERLKRTVLLAAESLTIKRKVLENFSDKNLYPYSKFYLRHVKSAIP